MTPSESYNDTSTMQSTKSACGITLDCLYIRIEILHRQAQLQAHKKFLAARLIQKIYRGYRVRKSIEICTEKAIAIQRIFRGFRARKQFCTMLEMRVQRQFEERYNEYALIIQKRFRGYHSRKYKHDFRKLRTKQEEAAKELILYVAHKLHHLLKTRQIPGIYSLRNSHCLSKVEELLASLRFKEYNEEIRLQRCDYKQKIAAVEVNRREKKVKLNIPFGPRCQEIYKNYSTQKLHQTLGKVGDKPKKPLPKPVPISGIIPPDDGVYAKVVRSMEKCNIVKFDDLSVCPLVLHYPEKIEHFCTEMTQFCKAQRLCPENRTFDVHL